jgi:hypothetical protein
MQDRVTYRAYLVEFNKLSAPSPALVLRGHSRRSTECFAKDDGQEQFIRLICKRWGSRGD